jgi:prolyl-tRNA editing enzyme YbaK/EbsC (Cys-tRNA(Pro) deacylase)
MAPTQTLSEIALEACKARLRHFLDTRGATYSLIECKDGAAVSTQAAAAIGVSAAEIVKTIVCASELGERFACVLAGDRRIDTRSLKRMLKIRNVRMLSAEEMLIETGYPKGGIPPCDLPATFLIDTPLLHYPSPVYAGGGTPTTLLRIHPQEIARLTLARPFSLSTEQRTS